MTNEEFEIDYDWFGVCPYCKRSDGYINIGREQWSMCKLHKVKWRSGSNIGSAWRFQIEEEQRKICNDLGFNEYQEVESAEPPMIAKSPEARMDAIHPEVQFQGD